MRICDDQIEDCARYRPSTFPTVCSDGLNDPREIDVPRAQNLTLAVAIDREHVAQFVVAGVPRFLNT